MGNINDPRGKQTLALFAYIKIKCSQQTVRLNVACFT